jgi:gamma-glutamyltranspeptidase/glutathione hydrolase
MNRIAGFLLILFISGCKGNIKEVKQLVEGRGITVDNGLVVSAHIESSRVGAEILARGGNAIDAAIATEFALAVCYPEAGNIGGGGFMLIRRNDGSTDVIDYREKAPSEASRDMYLDKSGNIVQGLSTDTQLSSGVPGTVDGMILAHSKYGSLPLSDLIQPAINLAENGFKLTAGQADDLNGNRKFFDSRNGHATSFVKDSLWKEGDILVQTDLAETLKRIRDQGRNGFYSGRTAELIVSEMKRGNGIISYSDLFDYRAVIRSSISADYKGYRIITVPPPSGGGLILLQMLAMVEPYNIKQMGFNSAATVHLMAEAERRAFVDRAEYYGDPDYMKLPVSSFFNKRYALSRMKDFKEEKASLSANISAGNPAAYVSEETTHYSVADAFGNAVAATTTLNGTFGNSIVVEGAGFLLNNQMDDFSMKPGFPNMYGLVGGETNSIQPGKKILSSMSPSIVEKDGKLFMILGSPGGSTIPTSVFQVILNVLEHGMTMQQAVDTPRSHHQWLPDCIYYEAQRFDSNLSEELIAKGHQLKLRSSIGRVNAIMITDGNRKSSGADSRGDNVSCGY